MRFAYSVFAAIAFIASFGAATDSESANVLAKIDSFKEAGNKKPSPTTKPPPTRLNVHLKLDSVNANIAIGYNNQFRSILPNEAIFLDSTHDPHATLFLTQFDDAPAAIKAVDEIVKTLPACPVNLLKGGELNGAYHFWNIEKTPCLQFLCDTILNATSRFVTKDQTPPSWVTSMPDNQERRDRIYYVKTYGSPNVFNYFSPHVTIMYDDKDTKAQIEAAAAVLAKSIIASNSITTTLGAGSVGSFGTVLKGKDKKTWKLKSNCPTCPPSNGCEVMRCGADGKTTCVTNTCDNYPVIGVKACESTCVKP